MEIPQKTRITMWSSSRIPGHISRQSYNSKRSMHPCVHSSTIHDSQDVEMPINRCMDKGDAVHIRNGVLLGHKEERKNAVCSSTAATRDHHTKWSQKEKDRYRTVSLVCGIYTVTQMNLSIQQTHSHRDQTYRCQGGGLRARDRLGTGGHQMQTVTYGMDEQRGPTV